MKNMNLKLLLNEVRTLARQAGDRILEIYETDFTVNHKKDESPLTAADLAAHRCIRDGLLTLTPDVPLLSEESRDQTWTTRRDWDRYWLVDPLDGTKEFVKRNGEFTVNIALIVDHEPVLGVVHVPVSGISYAAARGVGAFKSKPGQPDQPISVRKPPAEPLRVVGSRSHPSDGLAEFLAQLGPHEVLPMGSSLKFCRVAEGDADIYPRLGLTSEWDTAAAQAVVECAGGKVLAAGGQPLNYNRKENILNPYFLVIGDSTRAWPAL